MSLFPMVPGHEITGIVSSVGDAVTTFAVGDRVGVGCFVDSCRSCSSCEAGLEQYCAGVVFTYSARGNDGATTQGGYSQELVVDQDYVLRIPESLPMDAAAPLLCAGITLYSPLRHWNVGPGVNVAIVGLGGLGHMGVKYAHAMGATVTVLSHSPRKSSDALRLGADHFYATSDPKTFQDLAESFDVIINTVSADIDWNAYMALLKVDGTMVEVGAPGAPVPVAAFSMIARRRSLAGSSIGGIAETQEMLDFSAEHGIVCDVEVIDIKNVNAAFERVLQSDVRYRFVIDVSTLAPGT